MVEFMSSWVKNLGLAIVIVSILEMLLPNNKTKKYIRMVMGVYVLFSIISPFISKKDLFNINNINFDDYNKEVATSTKVDQTSMDRRIEELYKQEIEKDITKKIEEMGFKVITCKVNAKISNDEDTSKISKIKLNIEKSEENKKGKEDTEESIENKIVVQVQKIKPINTYTGSEEKAETVSKNEDKVSKADIQNVKKFLIEEYGVNEKCLEIN